MWRLVLLNVKTMIWRSQNEQSPYKNVGSGNGNGVPSVAHLGVKNSGMAKTKIPDFPKKIKSHHFVQKCEVV